MHSVLPYFVCSFHELLKSRCPQDCSKLPREQLTHASHVKTRWSFHYVIMATILLFWPYPEDTLESRSKFPNLYSAYSTVPILGLQLFIGGVIYMHWPFHFILQSRHFTVISKLVLYLPGKLFAGRGQLNIMMKKGSKCQEKNCRRNS